MSGHNGNTMRVQALSVQRLAHHTQRVIELEERYKHAVLQDDRDRLRIAIKVHLHLATCPFRHSEHPSLRGLSYCMHFDYLEQLEAEKEKNNPKR